MSEKIQITFEISESFLNSIADFLSRITVMAVKEKEEEKEEEKKEETKEERTKEVSKEVSKEVVREEVKENNSFVSCVRDTGDVTGLCAGDVKGTVTGDVTGRNSEDTTEEYKVPSYSEVCDYVKRRQYVCDPKKFFTYYEKKNWVTRYGERIKFWAEAIDAWERRERAARPNALPFFRERQTTKDISDDLDSLMSRMERENEINDNTVCSTGN